jgi:DNA-binding NtrC family response regulator
MDVQLQAKLLRVIQEAEVDRLGGNGPIAVDVRIVATTNTNLTEAIERKTFRGDLYYRLNVIPVKIPPLRERNGDILYLADHFLEKFSREKGGRKPLLSDKAIALLGAYPFPGNVRELENIIERAVLMTNGSTITPESFCLDIQDPSDCGEAEAAPALVTGSGPSFNAGTTLKELEKTLIYDTLARVEGNKTKAAKMLGISVRTLWNKVHEYGVAENDSQ